MTCLFFNQCVSNSFCICLNYSAQKSSSSINAFCCWKLYQHRVCSYRWYLLFQEKETESGTCFFSDASAGHHSRSDCISLNLSFTMIPGPLFVLVSFILILLFKKKKKTTTQLNPIALHHFWMSCSLGAWKEINYCTLLEKSDGGLDVPPKHMQTQRTQQKIQNVDWSGFNPKAKPEGRDHISGLDVHFHWRPPCCVCVCVETLWVSPLITWFEEHSLENMTPLENLENMTHPLETMEHTLAILPCQPTKIRVAQLRRPAFPE